MATVGVKGLIQLFLYYKWTVACSSSHQS